MGFLPPVSPHLPADSTCLLQHPETVYIDTQSRGCRLTPQPHPASVAHRRLPSESLLVDLARLLSPLALALPRREVHILCPVEHEGLKEAG